MQTVENAPYTLMEMENGLSVYEKIKQRNKILRGVSVDKAWMYPQLFAPRLKFRKDQITGL